MRPAQLLSSVLLFSALSAASAPWSESWHLKAVRDIEDVLFPRADDSAAASSTAAAASSTAAASTAESTAKSTAKSSARSSDNDSSAAATTGSAAASSGAASSTGDSSDASTTGKSSGKSTTKGTATTKTSKSKTYGVTAGYGGISMITPNVYSSSSYYKIGNYVTFAWNFTSLSSTPTALDIYASCSANQATYTLALNQTVNGSTGAITWDTGDYQATATLPLLTETYTLIIIDAELPSISATAAYGGLAVYSAHTFGMYTPQAYSNTSGNDTEIYTCVTCASGAASSLEKQTMGFVIGMAAITIATFTLFVGGAGVF